jgi:D-alanyl-D-alanine dipeptidase
MIPWAALTAVLGAGPAPMVPVLSRIPDAVADLRYATADNFMKRQVYPREASCLLVPEAVEKLVQAAEALRAQGFRLKLWDCYRPHSVQYELWKVVSTPGLVADPKKGSKHNRGAAVDLTLVDLQGKEVELPTGFDDFSKASRHAYQGGSEVSRKHRAVLTAAMEAAGFKRNPMEWWHWELPEAGKFPLRDEPFSSADAGRPQLGDFPARERLDEPR